MADLTTKESFKRQKFKSVTIDGDKAFLRIMSGVERDAWATHVKSLSSDEDDARASQRIYAPLLVKCLADAAGNRIWEDADAAQLAADLDSTTIKALFDEAQNYNRLTVEALDESKNVSGGVGSGNSGSSSLPTSTTAP